VAPTEKKVEVHTEIDGTSIKVGTIFPHRHREKESMIFTYDETYLSTPGAYALEPSLPLNVGSHQTATGKNIFGAFGDSSPDRWGRRIIERREAIRAREAGVQPHVISEIEILLCVRDDVRQGALRYSDKGGRFLATDELGIPALIKLPELLALARRIDVEEADYSEMQELLLAGGSLGGARPKAHVLDSQGNLSIAKFPRPNGDDWDVMSWEKTLLDLAEKAGISVPESTLLSVGNEKALLVKRFDRLAGRRVGYVSAMTMLEKKDGEPGSYLDIAETIEKVSRQAGSDLRELWKRIVFNVLTTNKDDHLRNHGFLKTKGDSWSLSPAFDLNPNPGPGRFLSTAIDETDNAASLELCFSVIDYFRLTKSAALEILSQVMEAVKQWSEVARVNGIPQSQLLHMEKAFLHVESAKALKMLREK
jgi:serine/threonine-protein kinase HipA